MSALKVEIEQGKQRIEDLEQQVMAVKADTAASLHAVNVQTRYAARVQSAVRATPPDPYIAALGALIDADRAALLAKGK